MGDFFLSAAHFAYVLVFCGRSLSVAVPYHPDSVSSSSLVFAKSGLAL